MPQITRSGQDNRDLQATLQMNANLEQNIARRHQARRINESTKAQTEATLRAMGKKNTNVYVNEDGSTNIQEKVGKEWRDMDTTSEADETLKRAESVKTTIDGGKVDLNKANEAALKAKKDPRVEAALDAGLGRYGDINTEPFARDVNTDHVFVGPAAKAHQAIANTIAGQSSKPSVSNNPLLQIQPVQSSQPAGTGTVLAPTATGNTATSTSNAQLDPKAAEVVKASIEGRNLSFDERAAQHAKNNMGYEQNYNTELNAEIGGVETQDDAVATTIAQSKFVDPGRRYNELLNIGIEDGAQAIKASALGTAAQQGPLSRARTERNELIKQFNETAGKNVTSQLLTRRQKIEGDKLSVKTAEGLKTTAGNSTIFNNRTAVSTHLPSGDPQKTPTKVRSEDVNIGGDIVQSVELDDDGTTMWNSSGRETQLPTDGKSLSENPDMMRSIEQGLRNSEKLKDGKLKVRVEAMGKDVFIMFPKGFENKSANDIKNYLASNSPRTIINPNGRLFSANKRYNLLGLSKSEVEAKQKQLNENYYAQQRKNK